MAELPGVEVLQNEIEKARDKLKGYNENIKKLTGRDPSGPGIRRLLSDGSERVDDGDNFQMGRGRGRGRLFGLARRNIMEDSGPPAKRRIVGGAFSRLGPAPVPMRRTDREDSPYQEEELPHKLSVQSSVVSTSRETKNRKEIMEEQTKDKEGMQRNRRMFGLLMGTLNKFKTESKTLQSKEDQRKKIDQKLEENAAREKRKFQQETKLLVEEMHLEQSKISRLQQKMDMVQEHAEREEEMKKLKNFIVTKAKPKIFWRPRQMNSPAEVQLKESKKVVDNMLQEGRDRLESEIKELMDRETKREERIKMRLREDGLLEGDGHGVIEEGGGDEGGEREAMAGRLRDRAEAGEEEGSEEEEEVTVRKVRRRVVVDTADMGGSESGGEETGPNRDVVGVEGSPLVAKGGKSKVGGEDSEQREGEGEDSSASNDEEEEGNCVEKETECGDGGSNVSPGHATNRLETGGGGEVVDRQDTQNDNQVEDRGKEKKGQEREEEESGRLQKHDKAESDEREGKRRRRDTEDSEEREVRKKRQDEEEEKGRRKRRHEREDSVERDLKRKGEREDNLEGKKSWRRRGEEDRRRARRDSREEDRSRRDSREEDRSRRDSRDGESRVKRENREERREGRRQSREESKGHHGKDKSKGEREEVRIKEEVEEKDRSEGKGSRGEQQRGWSERGGDGRVAVRREEEEDVDMDSEDQEES